MVFVVSVSKYISGGLVSEAYIFLVLYLGFGLSGVVTQDEIVVNNFITHVYYHPNPLLWFWGKRQFHWSWCYCYYVQM